MDLRGNGHPPTTDEPLEYLDTGRDEGALGDVGRALLRRDHLHDHPAAYAAGVRDALVRAQAVLDEQVRQQSAARQRLVFHELRTPATVFAATVDTLVERVDELTPAMQATLLSTVHRQAWQLVTLLGQLQASSEVDGSFVVELGTSDLTVVLTDVLDDIDALVGTHPIERHIGTAPSLAGCDPVAVRRILIALVNNAVQYSPTASPIEVALEDESDVAIVSVTSGRGHHRDHLGEDVFELGQRGTSDPGGSGVGLFVARGLAKAQGGDLSLRRGGDADGTTFDLRLPSRSS